MKSTALLLVMLAIFSCKKSKYETDIVGSWELRKSEGSLAGTINYPPGNGTTFTFTSNETFTHSDSLSHYSGTYTVFPISNEEWSLKLYNSSGGLISEHTVRISSTQLIFLPPVNGADYPTDTYVRL